MAHATTPTRRHSVDTEMKIPEGEGATVETLVETTF